MDRAARRTGHKEKLALEAQQQLQELEPLRTESFQLNYQKAEAFQKILTDGQQKILSKRGSAVIDPRTNTLFINDAGQAGESAPCSSRSTCPRVRC